MVKLGDVQTFREVRPDKEQALKVVEEACEVFGAWQNASRGVYAWTDRLALLDECADVIQATCNLIAALGIEDFAPYMEDCRMRNEKRGRM